MIDSDTNGTKTVESGIKSAQDKTTELRILPYYCSWYRSIFPRDTSELPVPGNESATVRTPGD